MKYFELEQLFKKALIQKKKSEGRYAEVSIDNCYAGGGFELEISYSGSDEGMPNLFYVTPYYEDDVNLDIGVSDRLKDAVQEAFSMNSELSEMNPEIQVDDSSIRRLEDIANGQNFLFESKNRKIR